MLSQGRFIFTTTSAPYTVGLSTSFQSLASSVRLPPYKLTEFPDPRQAVEARASARTRADRMARGSMVVSSGLRGLKSSAPGGWSQLRPDPTAEPRRARRCAEEEMA